MVFGISSLGGSFRTHQQQDGILARGNVGIKAKTTAVQRLCPDGLGGVAGSCIFQCGLERRLAFLAQQAGQHMVLELSRVQSEQLACSPIGSKYATVPPEHQVGCGGMVIKRLKMAKLPGQLLFILRQLGMLQIQLDLMGLQFVQQLQGIAGPFRVAGQTIKR